MPNDVVFSQCLHCGKNSRHRGGRNYWTCRHCGKKNPGPELVRSVFGDQLAVEPPAAKPNGKPHGNGGTLIQSGKPKEAVKVTPAAVKKEAPKTPTATATPTAKERSLFERVLHG